MAKFQKKPLIVEAEQFLGCGWYEARGLPYPRGHCLCDAGKVISDSPHSHVHTIHDGQVVLLSVGDWIIAEPDGEHFYPCRPDIFAETYKPVIDDLGHSVPHHGSGPDNQ